MLKITLFSLNRFIQPDTIVSNPVNPQTWNRYSYVSNRPVNFNDPTGHRDEEDPISTSGCHDPYYCDHGKPRTPDNPYVSPYGSANFQRTAKHCVFEECIGANDQSDATLKPDICAVTANLCIRPEIPDITTEVTHITASLRETMGYIDPASPGALTGSNINLVESYMMSVRIYVAMNMQNSNNDLARATLAIAPIMPIVAHGYDYAYDQITNSGEYSNLPPRNLDASNLSKMTPNQRVWLAVDVAVTSAIVVAIVIPK